MKNNPLNAQRLTLSALIITTIITVAVFATSTLISETPTHTVTVLKTYPHDENAFTQGLVFQDGELYESTGIYGNSSLKKTDPATGETLKTQSLADEYFGEGITIQGDNIVQLTWESKIGFIYDKKTFEQTDKFLYPIKGWGLTTSGRFLIASDGSETLYFINPKTYTKEYTLEVTDQGKPVTGLNELEYINGQIYANVFPTDKIAIIDTATGGVTDWLDLTNLEAGPSAGVLNGIAYKEESDTLLVTGKNWSYLYEISIQ